MSKIGLFYSFQTKKTAEVAEKIKSKFKNHELVAVDVNQELNEELFGQFDKMILGSATWFDGELPLYWDEFVPTIEDMNFSGKTVAVFGLGNQKGFPENFNDAIGILVNLLSERGAKIVGYTSSVGYDFERSLAQEGNQLKGLALDTENQADQTDKRIEDWVVQLENEF